MKLKIFALVTTVLLMVTPLAQAGSSAENVMAQDPYARAVAKTVRSSAAFMVFHNHGGEDATIVRVEGDVADAVEMHEHVMSKGMMRMQQVKQLVVPANGMLTLQPGGYHIMLIGLKQALEEGGDISLNLVFADGSEKTITMPVRASAAMPMNKQGKMDMQHDHGHQH